MAERPIVSRRWLLGSAALGIGAVVAAKVSRLFIGRLAPSVDENVAAPAGPLAIIPDPRLLPPIVLVLAGPHPNTTFPPPLAIDNLPAEYRPSDVLRLFFDQGKVIGGINHVDHVLVEEDAQNETITFGSAISGIASGITAFAIQGRRGDLAGPVSATIVHGDTAPPVLSVRGGAHQSIAEQQQLAIVVGLDKPGTLSVEGSTAVEAHPIDPISTAFRLVGNARLDSKVAREVAFTAVGIDLSGNVSRKDIVVTVLEKDKVPNPFDFADAPGTAPGTLAHSNAITVAGLDPGIFAPVAIVGGEWRKNGGRWIAPPGTVVNGDTVEVRGAAPAAAGQAVVVLTIGTVSASFRIMTPDYSAAPTFSAKRSAAQYARFNNDRTVAGSANAKSGFAESELGRAPGSGRYWIEASYDKVGEPRFALGLAGAAQPPSNADVGTGRLLLLFMAAGESGDGYASSDRSHGPYPFPIASGLVLPADHKALLVDLVAGTCTGYQGSRKGAALPIPPALMASPTVYAVAHLGDGDVCTWQPTSNKPLHVRDF